MQKSLDEQLTDELFIALSRERCPETDVPELVCSGLGPLPRSLTGVDTIPPLLTLVKPASVSPSESRGTKRAIFDPGEHWIVNILASLWHHCFVGPGTRATPRPCVCWSEWCHSCPCPRVVRWNVLSSQTCSLWRFCVLSEPLRNVQSCSCTLWLSQVCESVSSRSFEAELIFQISQPMSCYNTRFLSCPAFVYQAP